MRAADRSNMAGVGCAYIGRRRKVGMAERAGDDGELLPVLKHRVA